MLLALVLATTTLLASEAGPVPAQQPFRAIVNRSNPATSISRAELSAIYLRKLQSWPDKAVVTPVDHKLPSRVRDDFARWVHGKTAAYVVRYWQRLIFSGRAIPPAEVDSDEAVVRFIAADRYAIGYVSLNATLSPEVKIIEVRP